MWITIGNSTLSGKNILSFWTSGTSVIKHGDSMEIPGPCPFLGDPVGAEEPWVSFFFHKKWGTKEILRS
jgi:hypothetical protein